MKEAGWMLPRREPSERTPGWDRWPVWRGEGAVSFHSPDHSFDVSYTEARRIQDSLRRNVELIDRVVSPEGAGLVGGADVAFVTLPSGFSENDVVNSIRNALLSPRGGGPPRHGRRDGESYALAAVVTFDARKRAVAEKVFALAPVRFPYIPGLLTFREGPALLAAYRELKTPPGVMLYDGAGIAHPRGLGIAAHMALLTGIPSIGCAKSLLTGTCDEPGMEKGAWTPILLDGRPAGSCLRTKRGVKPLFISPGSGFSVDGARRFVMELGGAHRLPEPTRIAHIEAARAKARIVK